MLKNLSKFGRILIENKNRIIIFILQLFKLSIFF